MAEATLRKIEQFRHLTRCLDRVHHIPGRIRYRVNLAEALGNVGRSPWGVSDLDRVLERLPGIRSVRINLAAFSFVVEYDPRVIPPPAWDDILEGRETPEAGVLLDILETRFRELTHAES